MFVLLTIVSIMVAQFCGRNDLILLHARTAEWKRTNGMYRDCRFYENPEERLLNEVLPQADYSKGGVYLIGASTMQTSVALWGLPLPERKLVHNYSIGGSTYTQQFHFIRYLVDQERLLRAGGDKNCVIIGLFFVAGEHRETVNPHSMFQSFFIKNGMYTYDFEYGIKRATMSPLRRRFEIQQIRNQAFYTWAFRVALGGYGLDYLRLMNRQPSDAIRNYWLNRLGPNWKMGLDFEIEQLGELLDYLRSHNVVVKAVYLPQGSWFRDYPPAEYHRTRVFEMLSVKSVPFTDLADQVSDDQWVDSVHFGYKGVQTVEPAILKLARDHLSQKGLLH